MPTDLTYREGGINDEYPFLLGHEAAGTVDAVGEGVTNVEPGDFVILNWRAVCGQCRACARASVVLLQHVQRHSEDDPDRRDGADSPRWASARSPSRRSCTRTMHQRFTRHRPAVAGLLGCGVMAGIGAAINTGAVGRDDTVAVIGCGGVGDAAIAGPDWWARGKSSPSTPTTPNSNGPATSAPPTPSTREPPTWWKPSRNSPTDSAPTS